MLEIILNNGSLEVPNDAIKYTKVGNDIADLSSRETDYTDSFSLPKSANNVNLLQGLGLKNDTSIVPYSKVEATLVDDGMVLINKGWLNVKETSNEFKINLYHGLIDLFKAIENKTFGDDVDLSEINHTKDLGTVIASFTNPYYRYIINDYGGKTHLPTGEINIDYLVPSVRVSYLWNKIFTTFGFTQIGNVFNTFDFSELWLTYPKGVDTNLTPVLYAEFLQWDGNVFNSISVINGSNLNNESYIVPSNGIYNINFDGLINYDLPNLSTQTEGIYLTVNGNPLYYSYLSPLNNVIISLAQGDQISLTWSLAFGSFNYADGFFKISKYNTLISFSEELKQLKITDFFKEILNRFALTIFVNKDNEYIFKTFDERLQSQVIDWSDKYIERTNETYTAKSYGQINTFRQEYRDERLDHADGKFSISNKNLEPEKEILKSKIFSAEKELSTFKINTTTNENIYATPLWEKEITENNGTQQIKYKVLSKRFYFLRTETITQNAILKSEVLGSTQTVNTLPVARFLTTAYKDFVPRYYNNIQLLLNDFRFHKIKLALTTIDFINLDFDKIYYFEQEQNYYFLNKVSFEKGKESTAEFYRIKYSESSLFGLNLYITNYNTLTGIEFTEIIPYTESMIIVEINGVGISAFYSNPLTGFAILPGQTIRFLDINSNIPISNIYIV